MLHCPISTSHSGAGIKERLAIDPRVERGYGDSIFDEAGAVVDGRAGILRSLLNRNNPVWVMTNLSNG
jgi:hypothetical protein